MASSGSGQDHTGKSLETTELLDIFSNNNAHSDNSGAGEPNFQLENEFFDIGQPDFEPNLIFPGYENTYTMTSRDTDSHRNIIYRENFSNADEWAQDSEEYRHKNSQNGQKIDKNGQNEGRDFLESHASVGGPALGSDWRPFFP